jgi:polar amino acid transport system permease protein
MVTDPSTEPGPAGPDTQNELPIKAVPLRHPARWVLGAIVLVLVAMLINTLLFSHELRNGQVQPRFQWSVVFQYFTTGPVLRGLVITLELTAISMTVGILLGIVLAVMRLSKSSLLSSISWVYIWFFRGTPVLVQLLFWYEISYNYMQLSLGVPFGPSFVSFNTNTAITAFGAAVLGLSLNEAAYMAEIVRAGIQSVDVGQNEAAQSIGMSSLMTLRHIVLPQAMRLIIPPTGNETISMLKTSSLASVVAVTELLLATDNISERTYQTVPLLMVASIWYLIVTSILTIGQYYVERRYSRGSARELPPTPWQHLRRRLFKYHDTPVVDPPIPTLGGAHG